MKNESLLRHALEDIKKAEVLKDYKARNLKVYAALWLAQDSGLEAGIRLDSKESDWPVVFIELPTGQVSWHVPQHIKDWDGHDTITKYERVDAFVEKVLV